MATQLEIRAFAVEQTIAEWKDRPFTLGKYDCWKLITTTLRKMGKSIPRSNKGQGYKTALSAMAELRRVYGVNTIASVMDKFFKRIVPAEALPGDIMTMPGFEDDRNLGAIGIYIGNQQVFAYVEGYDTPQTGELTYDEGAEPLTAWRILP